MRHVDVISLVFFGAYQRKKGSQQARKADTMIPSVLAALRSRFILLLVPGSGAFSVASPPSTDWRSDVSPAEIPLIWRCLLSRAAATLLLEKEENIQSNLLPVNIRQG
jgi:hypothetical protein